MGLLSKFLSVISGDGDNVSRSESSDGKATIFTRNIGESKFEVIHRPSSSSESGSTFDFKVDGKVVERHSDSD